MHHSGPIVKRIQMVWQPMVFCCVILKVTGVKIWSQVCGGKSLYLVKCLDSGIVDLQSTGEKPWVQSFSKFLNLIAKFFISNIVFFEVFILIFEQLVVWTYDLLTMCRYLRTINTFRALIIKVKQTMDRPSKCEPFLMCLIGILFSNFLSII